MTYCKAPVKQITVCNILYQYYGDIPNTKKDREEFRQKALENGLRVSYRNYDYNPKIVAAFIKG